MEELTLKLDNWYKADRNSQYRLLNALIKEDIFHKGTIISEFEHQLEIQYHAQVLNISLKRVGQFQRYEFENDVHYSCGNSKCKIASLEELIDYLRDYFEIDISERLSKELIHSRDSFVEIYEKYDYRKSLIEQSMKFSRLPQTLNFFSWIQHFKANSHIDDLIYSESLVLEGHPTHPLSKTKLPMTMEEVEKYSPEFEKTIQLKVMLISEKRAVVTSTDENPNFILDYVIPHFRDDLRVFLAPLGLVLEDYRVILVHPWQYDHMISTKFSEWITNQCLIPTPLIVDAKATSSFRTMSLIDQPYHIKLPTHVQATSAIRTVSPVTTIDGPKLSHALAHIFDSYPNFNIALEPFGEYFDVDSNYARELACIIREKPSFQAGGTSLVSASLVNPNPIDNRITVDSYIQWVADEVNEANVSQFIQRYTQELVKPLIACIQTYGVALEAHMQNIIVNLGPQFEIKFLLRDLGGSRIHKESLYKSNPILEIKNESLLSNSIEGVIAKFQHAVIQNHLGELIHHFGQYEDINEQKLYGIVQAQLEEAIDYTQPHAHILKKTLFAPTMKVKALLRMRMEDKVKQYLNIKVPNPIKKEV